MKVNTKTLFAKAAKIALVAALASSLALVGCKSDDDDDDDGSKPPATVAVTGVSVSPTTVSVEAGATTTLTATVSPSNATDKTVSWKSSDESIATVANGTVTGVKEGTATITVTTTDGGKTATSTVTVTKAIAYNKLDTRDFEGVTDVTTVANSPNAAECLTIATDKTNYIKFVNDQAKGSDRSMYLTEALKVPESGAYIIEFDAALNGLHGNKRFNQLALLTGDEPKTNTKTANIIYKDNFLLTLTCGAANGGRGGSWVINTTKENVDNNLVEDADGSVTLTDDAWNHYVITVDGTKVTLTISGTDTLDTKTLTLPTNTGAPKWFYFNGAGGGGAILLDNLVIKQAAE